MESDLRARAEELVGAWFNKWGKLPSYECAYADLQERIASLLKREADDTRTSDPDSGAQGRTGASDLRAIQRLKARINRGERPTPQELLDGLDMGIALLQREDRPRFHTGKQVFEHYGVQREEPVKRDSGMADGCLDMIRETLEAMGTDMTHRPPMMYGEAIQDTVTRLVGREEPMPVAWREKFFWADCTLDGICGVVQECCDAIENTPQDADHTTLDKLLEGVLFKLHNGLLEVEREYTNADPKPAHPRVVGYIGPDALDQLDYAGSVKIWREPNPNESREQALYTSPPQAGRDSEAMEKLRERTKGQDLRWIWNHFYGKLCVTTQVGETDPADAILATEGDETNED